MSSKDQKKTKRFKKPLKVKPAVVPKKTRKIKTKKKKKSPISYYEEKKLRVRNIVFTIIFGALFVASFFFQQIIKKIFEIPSDALTNLIIQLVQYILIGLFLYITVLSFETYKVEFSPKPLRILLTIITAIVFFPLILFKYYTRHNVWRIIFIGATIWSLFLTFFGAYFGGVLYRDSQQGAPEDQNEIDTSFLSAPFVINLPIDIDSLMDLLDNLGELDEPTLESTVAQITALDGNLGNYLYRWDVYDRYSTEEWEFEKSNQATLYEIPSEERGEPESFDNTNDVKMNINQTVYTASSAVDISLLTTWNSINRPHIDIQTNWGNSITDENGTVVGTSDATVKYNVRDQLQLQGSVEKTDPLTPFQGSFEYSSYFMLEDDMDTIMQNTVKYSDLDSAYLNSEYSMFLHAPDGYYDTISTSVTNFADVEIYENIIENDPSIEIYDVVTSVIQNVLTKGDVSNIFGGGNVDTGGEDPANVLARNEPSTASAYISLTVMTLRRLGIPVRPVMGFAVGTGDTTQRELKVANLYYWIETLLPLDNDADGTADEYRWGQFQVGPYPVDDTNYIYCENSLNAQYELSLQLYEEAPDDLQTFDINGQSAYLVDYGVDYTIEVNVSRGGSPASNVPVRLKTLTTSQVQSGFDSSLLSSSTDIMNPIYSDATGKAITSYTFSPDNYSIFDLGNQAQTSYVLIALNGLTNYDAKGVAIFPRGYLTDVVLNASSQTIPNPQNPAETKNYYLIQQGWEFEMYSLLYRNGPPGSDPLENRTVTYYLLTPEQLQQLQDGATLDPTQFTEIGTAKTDSLGNSSVTSINDSTGVDYFASLEVNTTYALTAVYGLNYSFAPIVIIDGLIASVKVNDTTLDTGVDGFTMWEEINVTLQMQPPNGVAEPLKNEDVWLWIVYEDDWQVYDGSITGTEYNTTLNGTTRSKYIGYYQTDQNGELIENYLINASELGAGSFKIVAIYSERWEGSEDIFITLAPALSITTEDESVNERNLSQFIQSKNVDFGIFFSCLLSFFTLYLKLIHTSNNSNMRKIYSKSFVKTYGEVKQ